MENKDDARTAAGGAPVEAVVMPPSSNIPDSACWQFADTAPYGTKVLAWVHLPKNPVASGYAIAERIFILEDEPKSYGEQRMTVGCWWANGRYYHAGSETGYVAKWMPLPGPPAA